MLEIIEVMLLAANTAGIAFIIAGTIGGKRKAEPEKKYGGDEEKRNIAQEMAEKRFSEGVLNVLNYAGPEGRESGR